MGKLNPYTARVDRMHPTALVFLIDQSGSMCNSLNFGGTYMSKDQAVANAINKTMEEIISRCSKPDLRHYFDIAIIGYGESVTPLYNDNGSPWVSPEWLHENAKYRKEEREVRIRGNVQMQIADVPYWIEPESNGLTPMYKAFEMAENLVSQWCENHRGMDCYPPVVINITDGVQTDAEDSDMVTIAKKLKQNNTIDGNVLLFNFHLSDDDSSEAVMFPCDKLEVSGGGSYSDMLFEMSSQLPSIYNDQIAVLRSEPKGKGYRAMGFNTSADFVRMLEIGTITNPSEDDDE